MPKVYATIDYDGDVIERDAHISVFDSREDAVAFLSQSYTRESGWDPESIVIGPADFADCWIKSPEPPRVGTRWLAPFSYTQISIKRPGEHPGGKVYWITPKPDILVVKSIRELED